jgi:hypothetical protein
VIHIFPAGNSPRQFQRNVPPADWFILLLTLVWEGRVIFRRFALSVAVITAIGADAVCQATVVGSAAAEDGQLAFNNVCRTCHTLEEGDNRLGPSLHKIIGRKAGSLPNYRYSNAMKGADLVWTGRRSTASSVIQTM